MSKLPFDAPIRPLTNELRRQGFELDGDTSAGGLRMMMFQKRVSPARLLTVRLCGDGDHSVTHRLAGSENTPVSRFSTVEEMRASIKHETERKDNRGYVNYCIEHYEGGYAFAIEVFASLLAKGSLGSDETQESALVRGFAAALLAKLTAAEEKCGYKGAWRRRDWLSELRAELLRHVDKGDPVDVAAYCAFAWFHGLNLAIEPAP